MSGIPPPEVMCNLSVAPSIRNSRVADWRSRGGHARDRVPCPTGRGLGGTDGSRTARGVVCERRRARPERGRRGGLPLGRRRGAARDGARRGARRATRARLGRGGRGGIHARGGRGGHAPARARSHAAVLDRARTAGANAQLRVSDATGRVFDALADANRRYVLEALAERETATATELASELPVTRQAVAKHLAALSEAGLVEGRRAGPAPRYELTP